MTSPRSESRSPSSRVAELSPTTYAGSALGFGHPTPGLPHGRVRSLPQQRKGPAAARSPCSSRTGSAATRTCGASSRPRSRTTTASCSSTTSGSRQVRPRRVRRARYSTLDGYAQDVLDVCHALDLHDVIFVGHSVSSMVGVLAANREPDRFARLVLVGPSPRYINDAPDYVGGFERATSRGCSRRWRRTTSGGRTSSRRRS